jgi:hypothetical protein
MASLRKPFPCRVPSFLASNDLCASLCRVDQVTVVMYSPTFGTSLPLLSVSVSLPSLSLSLSAYRKITGESSPSNNIAIVRRKASLSLFELKTRSRVRYEVTSERARLGSSRPPLSRTSVCIPFLTSVMSDRGMALSCSEAELRKKVNLSLLEDFQTISLAAGSKQTTLGLG